MISSYQEYKLYIEADKAANHANKWPQSRTKIGWQLIKKVRMLEYVMNCRSGLFAKIEIYVLKYFVLRESVRTGILLPPNTFGKGLFLPHYGSIVVNHTARFGDNCVIQNGVNISENVRGANHIYIGAGAKILSNVFIADDVIIGANAVVTKDINEPNVVVAGIPAKIISTNGFRNRSSI